MILLSGTGKRQQDIFRKPKSIHGFFGFESSLQNCFWIFFYHLWFVFNLENKKCLETYKSVLEIYTNLKLCKDFLEFKNIILEVKLFNKFKNGLKKFKSLILIVLGYPSRKCLNHVNPNARKFFFTF
jgi:hypothetical protein